MTSFILSRSHIRTITVCAMSAMILSPFQNCGGRPRFSDHGTPTMEKSESGNGNGGPYEGVIYSSQSRCDDGKPSISVKFLGTDSALLLRKDCLDVLPPRVLNESNFALDPIDPSRLIFEGSVLTLEVENKISFVQKASGGKHVHFKKVATASNLMVCAIIYERPDSQGEWALADTNGDMFSRAGSIQGRGSDDQFVMEIWYSENLAVANAPLTVKAGFTGTFTKKFKMTCLEYAGIAPKDSLLSIASGKSDSSGAAVLGPVKADTPNELVLAAFMGEKIHAGPGFTRRGRGHWGAIVDRFTTSPDDITAEANTGSAWSGLLLRFRSR